MHHCRRYHTRFALLHTQRKPTQRKEWTRADARDYIAPILFETTAAPAAAASIHAHAPQFYLQMWPSEPQRTLYRAQILVFDALLNARLLDAYQCSLRATAARAVTQLFAVLHTNLHLPRLIVDMIVAWYVALCVVGTQNTYEQVVVAATDTASAPYRDIAGRLAARDYAHSGVCVAQPVFELQIVGNVYDPRVPVLLLDDDMCADAAALDVVMLQRAVDDRQETVQTKEVAQQCIESPTTNNDVQWFVFRGLEAPIESHIWGTCDGDQFHLRRRAHQHHLYKIGASRTVSLHNQGSYFLALLIWCAPPFRVDAHVYAHDRWRFERVSRAWAALYCVGRVCDACRAKITAHSVLFATHLDRCCHAHVPVVAPTGAQQCRYTDIARFYATDARGNISRAPPLKVFVRQVKTVACD